MLNYEALEKVSRNLDAIEMEDGKRYVTVSQRVKGFRQLLPSGSIQTKILKLSNGECIMQATIYDEEGRTLSTGIACEVEGSSSINATSYIENCETSAVGRALAMLGIGSETSISSYDEVRDAKEIRGEIKVNSSIAPTKEQIKAQDDKEKLEAVKEQVPENTLINPLQQPLQTEIKPSTPIKGGFIDIPLTTTETIPEPVNEPANMVPDPVPTELVEQTELFESISLEDALETPLTNERYKGKTVREVYEAKKRNLLTLGMYADENSADYLAIKKVIASDSNLYDECKRHTSYAKLIA